ncbi:MAG: endolytic transglycosylase MltG [Nitrospiraceae bacterium]|nr:endolytic transglycosylase MltG [Nitrospiraceae bacterium]
MKKIKLNIKRDIKVILICVLLVNILYAYIAFMIPLPLGPDAREIRIPKGATFRQVVDVLAKENLVRDKNLFLLIGRITGLHKKIRVGYYSIAGTMSPFDILRMLERGEIIQNTVTIIEGESLSEIAEKLDEMEIVDKETFKAMAKDTVFLDSYNIEAPSVEGYLFPDTYNIPKGTEPEEVLSFMIDSMREKFSEKFRKRAEELGMSENEILTMASIIEKEAVVDKERPIISAVYHNRLKKNMKLQADPTAIYGVKNPRAKVTLKDLKSNTKYNTYVIKGLPPGPIASPGIKSIEAALYPADVPYIYFVSNNDGTHIFSTSSKQHAKAVESYREKKNKSREDKKAKANGSS